MSGKYVVNNLYRGRDNQDLKVFDWFTATYMDATNLYQIVPVHTEGGTVGLFRPKYADVIRVYKSTEEVLAVYDDVKKVKVEDIQINIIG